MKGKQVIALDEQLKKLTAAIVIARLVCHSDAGGMSKLVAGADNEIIKGVFRN